MRSFAGAFSCVLLQGFFPAFFCRGFFPCTKSHGLFLCGLSQVLFPCAVPLGHFPCALSHGLFRIGCSLRSFVGSISVRCLQGLFPCVLSQGFFSVHYNARAFFVRSIALTLPRRSFAGAVSVLSFTRAFLRGFCQHLFRDGFFNASLSGSFSMPHFAETFSWGLLPCAFLQRLSPCSPSFGLFAAFFRRGFFHAFFSRR